MLHPCLEDFKYVWAKWVKSAIFSIKDIQTVCFKMKAADLWIDVDSSGSLYKWLLLEL